MSPGQDIGYAESEHVGVLTLNRPDVHNALRRKTYDELTELVHGTTARVLVITGAGRSFCSGDDVRELMTGEAPPPPPRLTPAADALLHTDVPVIAAVNGPAVGWGMELALMADLRVAAASARFGELFVKRGLCSDVAGIARLAQLVGRETAAELLFTGDVIDAGRAERIGLVSRVVPDDHLMPAALELAGRIAANPPLAVAALKRGLRRALDPEWRDLGAWVSTTLGELFTTEDHREGVRSFLEKREPHYVGR
ncbi:enoyl-CoA hydratase/isomerase family protein [Amycolatopsis acidicola]|uniref:Enoyl-CoA hydratase/isomerase family protein n=1 Tax=Amycolatopsis acidicola TaxID=2596893 RepID=A0A5N0V1C1_9PSEU|nr:enoyl-CoA hydratase/isomerase family protein [Amycolatopsis acidicola]KAA9159621.1 enoyl-CoA hydratase/isomerase family protein [Amycolatopsis acidicola]